MAIWIAVALGTALAAAAASAQTPDLARGKASHKELCAKCHGSGGKGDGKEAATLETKPKDLTDCARIHRTRPAGTMS